MKRIFVILFPFLCSSCAWDNELYDTFVNKEGTVHLCPELGQIGALQYIEKNEHRCYRYDAVNVVAQEQKCKDEFDCCGLDREMARRYIHAFNNNICPKQYMCKNIDEPGEEHYYCKYSKCPIGLHVMPDSDECVEDSLTSCGSDNNNCLERKGMLLAECIDGECSALACDSHHHLQIVDEKKNIYACADNTLEACPVFDEDGNIAFDKDGNTRIKSCSVDISKGEDSAVCGEKGCQFDTCLMNYHLDENKKHCEKDSFEHCGAWYNDCRNNGKKTGRCEYNHLGEPICVAEDCDSGYTLVGDECLPNNNEHCGRDNLGNIQVCASYEVCDSIKAECVNNALGCPARMLKCGDVCINPSVDVYHCGYCDNRCDNLCIDGTCSCRKGYADCDQNQTCETHLLSKHLATCSTCLNDYYDINNNMSDGCELYLPNYGLELDVHGNLTCRTYRYMVNGEQQEYTYSRCGNYEIYVNNIPTTIPLCLNYLFTNEGNYKNDKWCENFCNSRSHTSSSAHKYQIDSSQCKPQQTCYPGPVQEKCYGQNNNERCYQYKEVICN